MREWAVSTILYIQKLNEVIVKRIGLLFGANYGTINRTE
ncbi:MAG: hypothetical protein K0Q59_4913 [Paenibacillus sp.]|jgi:hypothetical protein|nr:hypothetical protein [Paenibacillus sp.]